MSSDSQAAAVVSTEKVDGDVVLGEKEQATSNDNVYISQDPSQNPTDAADPEINLADQLKQLIEYYLSRPYLATDPVLVQQMDSELNVPISALLNFPSVQAITNDPVYLATIMRTSTSVTVDESGSKIKPNFKIRNTVILRDIPITTNVEDVKGIFNQCPVTPTSVRADIGDTWFITFDDDDAALKALQFVRVKDFQGKLIKARIKSENLLRSIYFQPEEEPSSNVAVGVTQPEYFFPYGRGWGGRSNWNQGQGQFNPYAAYDPQSQGGGNYRNFEHKGARRQNNRGGRGSGAPQGSVGGGSKEKKFSEGRKYGGPGDEGSNFSRDDRRNRKGRGRKQFGKPGAAVPPPQLGPSHFPPLSSSGGSKSPKSQQSGYSTEFTHYSKEELVGIVTKISHPPKPSLPDDCAVALKEPVTQLLVTSPDQKENQVTQNNSEGLSTTTTSTSITTTATHQHQQQSAWKSKTGNNNIKRPPKSNRNNEEESNQNTNTRRGNNSGNSGGSAGGKSGGEKHSTQQKYQKKNVTKNNNNNTNSGAGSAAASSGSAQSGAQTYAQALESGTHSSAANSTTSESG